MKKTTILSALLGTLIEVYDFTIFPLLIPILSEVFFSSYAKETAFNFTLLSYIVGYIIKPFGAVFFGYFIDRYGQKKILLITTILMTLATSAICLLPTKIIAIYGGLGLIICRIMQGLSISGGFSSAIIMSVEQGKNNPAFTGSLTFLGGSVGLLLANFTVFLLLSLVSHASIIQYAWRIPFLVGALGCLVLMFIRSKIEVSRAVSKIPSFRSLIKGQKKELLETFIVSSLSASAFYITFIFMPTFLSTIFNTHSYAQSTLITCASILTYIIFLPIGGRIADKIGINRQIKIASVFYIFFSYIIFFFISGLGSITCLLVLIFFAIIQATLNSALPAFIVHRFQPNQRGRALAISYNIALTIFGGLMPVLILSSSNHMNPGIPITI